MDFSLIILLLSRYNRLRTKPVVVCLLRPATLGLPSPSEIQNALLRCALVGRREDDLGRSKVTLAYGFALYEPEVYSFLQTYRIFATKEETITAPTPEVVGQDPVQVDPKHYRIEFENDRVRVLRVNYEAREKSVMHGHPPTVAVFLAEGRARFTFPDGNSEERSWQAGQTMMLSAELHLPENLTDRSIDLILIELKG